MNSKKRDERNVVEAARNLWAGFPEGEIICGEAPDFTVSSPEHRIFGFEVVRYHRQKEGRLGLPKEQDSLRKRTARQVESRLQQLGVQSMKIALFFREGHLLSKRSVSDEAAAIVELMRTAEIELESVVTIDAAKHRLPDSLTQISIARFAELSRVCCSVPSAVYVPALGPTEIQALINSKNAKVPKYLGRCDEVVLIIEIHGFQPASIADCDIDVCTHCFESEFSDVLILMDGNRLMELKVRQRPS